MLVGKNNFVSLGIMLYYYVFVYCLVSTYHPFELKNHKFTAELQAHNEGDTRSFNHILCLSSDSWIYWVYVPATEVCFSWHCLNSSFIPSSSKLELISSSKLELSANLNTLLNLPSFLFYVSSPLPFVSMVSCNNKKHLKYCKYFAFEVLVATVYYLSFLLDYLSEWANANLESIESILCS